MNSFQAKKLSLPQIMSRLGYEPIKITKNGNEYWYSSPFRNEKAPSFHTSFLGGKWIWKDFGDIGGTVIDFIMRHENYNSVSHALKFLDKMFGNTNLKSTNKTLSKFININEKTLVLDEVKGLQHPALIEYLTDERAINFSTANNYLNEIHFHNTENNKKYFALGMLNNSGGYEMRNAYFKSCLGKKDLSFFKGKGRGEICVFEGGLDFLSFLTDRKKRNLESDVIVLNSISFAEKAKSFIQDNNYSKIYAFFDNDAKGIETLETFKELPIKVVALNYLYKNYKDYNQYLQNKNKAVNINLK